MDGYNTIYLRFVLFICLLFLISLIMFNNLLNKVLSVGGWKSMFKRLVAVGAAAITTAAAMALPASARFGSWGLGFGWPWWGGLSLGTWGWPFWNWW
jgi:hypothetical protein